MQVCRKYVGFFSYLFYVPVFLYDGQYYETQGVKFHMASKVEKIVPQESNPTLAAGVVVNGTMIQADFVIMGVGVTPATSFLKESGIQIEKDGGVKVDQYLRVQSGPDTNDVYAIGIYVIFSCHCPLGLKLLCIGDIAIYPQIAGDYTRIEHWNVCLLGIHF